MATVMPSGDADEQAARARLVVQDYLELLAVARQVVHGHADAAPQPEPRQTYPRRNSRNPLRRPLAKPRARPGD